MKMISGPNLPGVRTLAARGQRDQLYVTGQALDEALDEALGSLGMGGGGCLFMGHHL